MSVCLLVSTLTTEPFNPLAPLGILALRRLLPEQFLREGVHKLQSKIQVGAFEDRE